MPPLLPPSPVSYLPRAESRGLTAAEPSPLSAHQRAPSFRAGRQRPPVGRWGGRGGGGPRLQHPPGAEGECGLGGCLGRSEPAGDGRLAVSPPGSEEVGQGHPNSLLFVPFLSSFRAAADLLPAPAAPSVPAQPGVLARALRPAPPRPGRPGIRWPRLPGRRERRPFLGGGGGEQESCVSSGRSGAAARAAPCALAAAGEGFWGPSFAPSGFIAEGTPLKPRGAERLWIWTGASVRT